MPNVITIKVDVRKLDKARFFEGKEDKNGHKPLYADLVLMPKKETGTYGDTHFVVQSKKKDEDIQMPIIGNATERGSSKPAGADPGGARQPTRPAPAEGSAPDADVPW
jgi:hypothetical protein